MFDVDIFIHFVDCSLMCEIEFYKNSFLGRHRCILEVKKIHSQSFNLILFSLKILLSTQISSFASFNGR